MVRLLQFLREVAVSPAYEFVDHPASPRGENTTGAQSHTRRQAAGESFARGIQCILKCQVRSNGKLTSWCAQHDEIDLSPRPGRSYELVSLSGSESVGIVKLLISLDHPGPEVIESVRAAVAWFEAAKLPGIKVIQKPDSAAPKGFDRIVVPEKNARPIWARFYEIGTNKPIFSDRDGVAKSSLTEIGYERRNGYSWLGYWPEDLLKKDYPAWQMKWNVAPSSP
jgi:PelA/Pel-15E family pectate lyase